MVVGPPGAGKTRLLRHYAQTRWELGPCFWLDLSECHDEDGLDTALALALQIPETPRDGSADESQQREARRARLARGLAGHGPALLVLDGFDHLARTCAGVLSSLSTQAFEARVVVTSRIALRGKQVRALRLGPLSLPRDVGDAGLMRSDAVQLLLLRAHGYRMRDEDANVIADLVEQLDGMPLAIELAARRLSLLTPRGLLERLPKGLDLLKSSSTSQGRTLRTTLRASWDALSTAERAVLSQCSVFRGEFEIGAAEAVVSLPDAQLLVLDVLECLSDHCLLQVVDDPAGPRFKLLTSIRQFAHDELDAEQLDAVRLRHAQYFARTPAAHADADNVASAYEYVSQGLFDVELRAALLLTLDPLVARHMPSEKRLRRLDEVLQAAFATDTLDPLQVARLLRCRGAALQHLGRMDEAQADLERAVRSAGSHGELSAELQCQLGNLHMTRGMTEAARGSFESALLSLRGLRHPALYGRVQLGLGALAHSQCKLEDARLHYDAAADSLRLSGARSAEAETLAYLGTLWLQLGRHDQARVSYRDALALLQEGGDRRLAAMVFGNLAILDQEQGCFAEASGHLEQGLSAAQQMGDRMLEGHLLGYRGCLLHETQNVLEAQRAYERAIAVLREVGDIRLEAIFLACLGSVHAARGLTEAAQEAFDQAESKLHRLGDQGALGAVSLHRGHLLLHRGREGEQRPAAAALMQEAVAQLVEAGRSDALYHASDDYRFALRLLSSRLESDALAVTRDEVGVLRFRPPGGQLQDISTRLSLRRLLGALVERRNGEPGTPLSNEELIAAGWPDEHIALEASMNRLKVSLAALRKLGLRELLLRTDGGYMLDPAIAVRVSD
jgi:predicted ATPase/predicted negative regulator of RcsB-dependent stress response